MARPVRAANPGSGMQRGSDFSDKTEVKLMRLNVISSVPWTLRLVQVGLAVGLWSMASITAAAEDAEHGHAAGEKAGLPQFDFAYWPGHIFWTLICFGVLYYVLSRLLLPKIEGPVAARKNRIESDLRSAEKLKSQIDAARAQTEKALDAARASAKEAAQAAQADIAAEGQRRRTDAVSQLESQIHAAEAKIDAARNTALQEFEALSAPLAGQITHQLAGFEPSAADITKVLGRVRKGEA